MEHQMPDPTPNEIQPSQTPPAWSASDSWLGLGLLIVLVVLMLAGTFLFPMEKISSIYLIAFEAILVLPIAIIFMWRRARWAELGFQSFDPRMLAVGCGLLMLVYALVIVHNLVMMSLGVFTQGEAILEMLGEVEATWALVVATVIVAPITEEMFFRGFLFKGLREKYGWKNALMFSSIIFGLFHLQLAALIPTFLLGALFAYLYQRTESIYPGIVLHFLVNAFGVLGLLAASQFGTF